MSTLSADVVICGAGMAGVATAYELAVRRGIREIVLLDERPPLSLTSARGTQAYRNWWPGPGDTMLRFMSRSIDLLEQLAVESGNIFQLNRRGYVFFTAQQQQAAELARSAAAVAALGAGTLRQHPGAEPYQPAAAAGFQGLPDGADLLDRELIRRHFAYVAEDTLAALHARRCGWLSAPLLGGWLLEQAQAHGVTLLQERLERLELAHERLNGVVLGSGARISCERLVVAAGPYLPQVAALLGQELPLVNELHGKLAFVDEQEVVPRQAPLLIWNDPLELPWTKNERRQLQADPQLRRLLRRLPPGVHCRPYDAGGRPLLLIIWTFEQQLQEPVWPPVFPRYYGEVLLRGMARLIPGLSSYFGRGSEGYVDGGYYCKTPDNRPLIGPLAVQGSYVIGALSGYGIMGSQAAAELLAAHMTGAPLPSYAPAFLPARFADAAYLANLGEQAARAGQL